jgi:uncharacterized membrane protein
MSNVFLVSIVGALLFGLAFLYLAADNWTNVPQGVVLGTVTLVVIFVVGFLYFLESRPAHFEPHDTGSSVSNAPGP